MQKELHRNGRASAARRRMAEGCGFEPRRRAQKCACVEAQNVSSILVVTTVFATNADGTTSLTRTRSPGSNPGRSHQFNLWERSSVEERGFHQFGRRKISQRPQPGTHAPPRAGHGGRVSSYHSPSRQACTRGRVRTQQHGGSYGKTNSI